MLLKKIIGNLLGAVTDVAPCFFTCLVASVRKVFGVFAVYAVVDERCDVAEIVFGQLSADLRKDLICPEFLVIP